MPDGKPDYRPRHQGEERLIEALVRQLVYRTSTPRPITRRGLADLMETFGVNTRSMGMNGRIRAVVYFDRIYLANNQAELWSVAHSFAHALLHATPSKPFICCDVDPEAEQQADTFARFLLTAGD